MSVERQEKCYDLKRLELMEEAKGIGITLEEIRTFLVEIKEE